ncbi:MAG: TPM domain-containing protein [Burkholderiaceae bacterium]
MGSWVLRLFKHRRFDERDVQRLLGPGALQRIEARVAASESGHSGEIRVCVEAGLPISYLRRHATPRERAVAMFGKLRVWDTEANNGVLIYLLLAEHAIEIVADRGLARRADAAAWQRITATMKAAFQRGEFEAGLNQAVDAVDVLLREHFVLAPGEANPNELPDAPDLR